MKSVPVKEKFEKYRCPLCHSDHTGRCSKSVPVERKCRWCWNLFRKKWVPYWTTTGHNVWRCGNCGSQESFPDNLDPNK
jgi:Zn finger protein HypA/HybF involved in hydrogenase expression